MEDKKISVIVPVYNVEKYLDKTISHIVNQTYKELEIILVDDGSTDKSGAICDKYAKLDSRIRVIHKENGGSSSARNVGIKNATGDYIGFLDADDWADSGMYERLLTVALKNDADICEVMSSDYSETGNLLKGPRLDTDAETFIPSSEDFRLLMLHLGDSSFCTKIIKSDFCKKFSFPESKLNEDFLLILQMLTATQGIYSIEKSYYNILIRDGSNQRSGFKKELYEAVIENSDYAYNQMITLYPECKKEALRFRYVQRLMFLLHIPIEQMTRDNMTYRYVLKSVRFGFFEWICNKYIKQVEKRNLILLSFAPRVIRTIHREIMRCRDRCNI